ncbi:hypothetical protein COY16_05810 [Candidatus Roizmanbacteria bacterium CG_4_10_14_0_2_um_filter_39_13]|uniref:Uncharacterized protein n=1 Tax=Candidatus Roizmanbacteria bacterium CG_4_10_14_0_2_um_filter_39_13 TaxID=1974825 RepID=A0A2M7TW75_9BACT|nr:MAG: hypothetical protein COY16_05810 [Candidatus Roizmanbacteria bacterium CG_4_10_14_0_2_um_filter_39_13]
MNKQFYSHLIDVTVIQIELSNLDLEPHEHRELITLVHTTIHHGVIEKILSELNENDKKTFLTNLSHDHHDNIWAHLHDVVENIEEKIKITSSAILEELQRDLNEVKNSV